MPKFLQPLINKANKPFWDALKEEKLLLQECISCGEIFFPPRVACPECLTDELKHFQSKGTGTLYAFTEVHAMTPGIKTPFTIGFIELDENPGRFLTRIEAPYESCEAVLRATSSSIGSKDSEQFKHSILPSSEIGNTSRRYFASHLGQMKMSSSTSRIPSEVTSSSGVNSVLQF